MNVTRQLLWFLLCSTTLPLAAPIDKVKLGATLLGGATVFSVLNKKNDPAIRAHREEDLIHNQDEFVQSGLGLGLGLFCSAYTPPKESAFPASFLKGIIHYLMFSEVLLSISNRKHLHIPLSFYTGYLLGFNNSLESIFMKEAALHPLVDPADAHVKKVTDTAQVTVKNYSFKNIAGGVPEQVREVVDLINNAEKYKQMGARVPKGIILVGPPGSGKTSIARAIAGEVEAYFAAVSGSAFVDQYVGTGAGRVRQLFEDARKAVNSQPIKEGLLQEKKYKKAVIFIDEIDAIGGARTSRDDGGSQEGRQTLNELLNQLDGFNQDTSLFIIGATNTPNYLDAALIRPGRFDRMVTIGYPDQASREAILRHYAGFIKHSPTIDFPRIAQKTAGLSPAALEALINEAAIRAVRLHKAVVTQELIEEALAQSELLRRK